MPTILAFVCYLIAFVCFLVATRAEHVGRRNLNLVAAGLAAFTLVPLVDALVALD